MDAQESQNPTPEQGQQLQASAQKTDEPGSTKLPLSDTSSDPSNSDPAAQAMQQADAAVKQAMQASTEAMQASTQSVQQAMSSADDHVSSAMNQAQDAVKQAVGGQHTPPESQ